MLTPAYQSPNKRVIQDLLTRAAEDISFREALLLDPEKALSGSGLSDDERRIVGSLKKVQLEEWGVDVRRYRAAVRDNGNSAPGVG
ncbi:hypothetical protein J2793_006942 [Paraburkholderia caledonica]|uniref:Extradiol ring-cleavage dioxygenase LigAB LigA subunit domain-containing protein n=1 Tax=Paraburkholderia caledonica TaxID=134536 RepID=A0AB73ITW4_9BURK|nr:hypothetical protein [Paraburkholderia caledonica]